MRARIGMMLAAMTGYMITPVSSTQYLLVSLLQGEFVVVVHGTAVDAGAECLTCNSLQDIHGCLVRLVRHLDAMAPRLVEHAEA